MKQYKFSVEDKFKYIKITEFKVLKIAKLVEKSQTTSFLSVILMAVFLVIFLLIFKIMIQLFKKSCIF